MTKNADISDCGKYRYSLSRIWDKTKPLVLFIGLNPSTADHEVDDRTLSSCIEFAKEWDYGGLYMVNIYAYRASNPKKLWEAQINGIDIIGSENDIKINQIMDKTDLTIAMWGDDAEDERLTVLSPILNENLYCLRTNKGSGRPTHPRYFWTNVDEKPDKPIPYSI